MTHRPRGIGIETKRLKKLHIFISAPENLPLGQAPSISYNLFGTYVINVRMASHIGFVCYKIDYFSPLQDLRDLNKNMLVFLHL